MSQKEVTINRNQIFEIPESLLEQAKNFRELMLLYECAIREITTKIEILDHEMGKSQPRNPIADIKSRVKNPNSILGKLQRQGLPISTQSIRDNLYDVAGVRLICSYIDDIYTLRAIIEAQDDIRIIEEKDYIKNPKDNGYRSLHLVVEIPVFLSTGKHYVFVEIQIRTIAMDFWASLEHEIRYKKEHINFEDVSDALLECANTIASTDEKMLKIRNLIDQQ